MSTEKSPIREKDKRDQVSLCSYLTEPSLAGFPHDHHD